MNYKITSEGKTSPRFCVPKIKKGGDLFRFQSKNFAIKDHCLFVILTKFQNEHIEILLQKGKEKQAG